MLHRWLELHCRCFSTIYWHWRIVILRIVLVIVLVSICIDLDILNTRGSFQLRPLLVIVVIWLIRTCIDRVRYECNRSLFVIILLLIVPDWGSWDLRLENRLLLVFNHQTTLISLCRAFLRGIFPIVFFILIYLSWLLLLILYNHLMISVWLIYNLLPFTQAPLCALPIRRPLRCSNVLAEAVKEETDEFFVRLLLIDLVELYSPEVLGHTPHRV